MVKQVAGEKSCAAYFLGSDFGFFLKDDGFFDYKGIKHDFSNLAVALRGRHQRSNAAIAVAALELAGEFPVDERAIRHGLQSVAWPGRFEIVRESPWVVLDGAHNGEGAKALAETLDEFRRGGRVKILFAAMEDKDWRQMLSVLLPRADELVLTRVAMDRSADPDMIARWLPGSVPYRVAGDACSGLRLLYDGAASNDTIVVAGSLYLLGEIRPSALELAKMT